MLQQRIKKNILLFATMLSASLIFLFGFIGVGTAKIAALPDYGLMDQMNQSIETKLHYAVSFALDKMRIATEAKHGKAAHNDIENLYSNIYGNFLGISSWAEDKIDEFEQITDIDTDSKSLQNLITQNANYLISNVINKLKEDSDDYADYKTYIDEMPSISNKQVSSAVATLWYSEK